MITVKAAENTPQEIKRSRDRVRYANMSDEAKKEKISRRIWTVPLSEGMSLCLLEKDYSSKVFFSNQQVMVCLFCQPALLICYVSLSGWKCFSSVKNYQNRQCFSHQKCVKWLLIPNHWLLSIGQQRRHGDGGRKRVRQPRCWLKGQCRRRRHMLAGEYNLCADGGNVGASVRFDLADLRFVLCSVLLTDDG